MELSKLEIQIVFPYEEAEPTRFEIRQTHNAKAIKGFVKSIVKERGRMMVSFNGKRLKDSQNIAELDFVQNEFLVEFLADE